ncbi:hypothetical protein [Rhodococcus sovatensis]|uniref:WXG100 family type VII secretion target n=1 Tax=Rhodococcus sovatensis TaxID=1805840 RepID=A0ABZ2PNQ0_9NOCA
MGIDTRIDGTPDSVHGVANWVAHAVAPRLQATADSLYAGRNSADAGWDGPASELFVSKTSSAATQVDDFVEAVNGFASLLSGAAEALAAAHATMSAARDAAAGAGLLVMRDSIASPILDDLQPAYRAAEDAVGVAREHERRYVQELKDVADGLLTRWFFVGSSMIVSGTIAGATKVYASSLTARADDMAARGMELVERARNAGPGTPASSVYQDWDLGRELIHGSDDVAKTAEALPDRVKVTGARLGGLIGALEMGYDIYSGVPADQAVASGVVGIGASAATGAAVGTLIGGPVGTAVGAGLGAVVGIAASGMVDGVFEEGYESVGDTLFDGVEAVQDTGKAISDLTAGAWRAVF